MAMPTGPTVLPFKAEKLSFSVSYKTNEAPTANVELSCICFDRQGEVLDYIQFNRRAALNSALKHSSCSYLPQQDAVQADEAIHMYPFDMSAQCEVMLLVASAPKSPLHRNDLGTSSKLQFQVHARESGKEQFKMLDVNLSLFVGQAAAKGSAALSNGHQTMMVAGVYTTPQGWTLNFDCTTFPEDHWGLLLPQLGSILQRWSFLSAAENAHKQQLQTVICSRKGQDQPLQQLADLLLPAANTADAGTCQSSNTAQQQEGSGPATLSGEQDATESARAAGAQAAELAKTDALVLELGWEVYKPKASDDEEGEDPPLVDFLLSILNLQGEELAAVGPDNTECEGVVVDEEEPEEQPEAEAKEPEAAEQDEPADGDAAEGEEGEAGDEQVEPEEDEETKAAKASAAAEAAAAEAQRAAANQRPLAEKFPLKRKVHLTLSELPHGARALMLSMSQFGGSGFKNVKSLHARLVLADKQQQRQQQQDTDGEGTVQNEEGEEEPKPSKKIPKKPARVLMHYRFDSVQGADANISQILMLKLYKEYPDSAFAVWQQQQVPDVASLLGDAAAAAAPAASSGSIAAGGSSEQAKELLKTVLAARKQLEKELADLKAKNEEEGIDDEEEGEPDLRLGKGEWRVRVLGITAAGDGPDALTETINNLLAYDGELDAAGLRCSTASKVAYPNRDTYFGGYENDAKSGVGLYVFANGGAYLGQYQLGKRHGQGLMILPDGAMYRGSFEADKFDGQGTYLYPDKSRYIGSWKSGKKHGSGTYWDTAGGCLRGEWSAGALKGQGQYDQPNYHFEGVFAKGVPAGPCSFTLSAFRTKDLPQAAASYVIAPYGPTLCGEGRYTLPQGATEETEATGDEDDEEHEADSDKAALPEHPKYEGLAYESASNPPCSKPDVPFPPPNAAIAAI